jgi:hypothetical protein
VDTVSHTAAYSVFMSRGKEGKFNITLTDSPDLPEKSTEVHIGNNGVRDI